jgi:hypothetical protein
MTRHRRALFACTLVACAWSCAAAAGASSFRETNEFADALAITQSYVEQYGAEHVLFVVDIDNTLLAMDQPLGSDQWFEWQEYLLGHEPDSPHLAAKDFGGLLAAQGLLFAAGKMHPPQPNQPELVRRIQDLDVNTLVLTSRGDEYRAATIRELRRNDYDFASSAPPITLFAGQGETIDESGSRFTPYRVDRLAEYGLTEKDARLFNLPEAPRDVSYGDGVLMVAGQHKGAMLLVFLKLSGRDYKAVVYVDDHGRHVHRVYDALIRHDIEVTSVHYQREDANVKRFQYGDKQAVTVRWREIERALSFDPE